MRFSKRAKTLLVALAFPLTSAFGVGAAACVATSAPRPIPRLSGPSPAEIVVGYARRHPDPAIKGAFADKLSRGEIKFLAEKPKEHAMASFGKRDGAYALTIDPARLKEEPTPAETEAVLSILSHEHAHYRQYVEGQMTNYHPRVDALSETQCTLTLLVEIDAHAKTCRDAKAYGWTSSVATHGCTQTQATIADYFLRERIENYPECKPVWEHFSTHVPGPRAAKPEAASARRTRKRSAPVYMAPP